MKDRIKELCDKANLPKPEMYTSFVWMRACGHFKKYVAFDLGVSPRTLSRWEDKTDKYLDERERCELVKSSIMFEYNQRIGETQ